MQKCESLIRVRQSRLAEASYMRYEMRKTHIEGSWRKTHFLCVELRGKRTTHFCVTYKYIYVRQPSLTCNKFLFYISLFLTPLLQREQTSRWATTKRHTYFPPFPLGLTDRRTERVVSCRPMPRSLPSFSPFVPLSFALSVPSFSVLALFLSFPLLLIE